MSNFIEKRKRQFVKHFLKPDKILKKFIPIIGQASAILGGGSVVAGKDIDVVGKIIDTILDPILGKIPGIGKFLVSEETRSEGSYIDSDGNVVMSDGGSSGVQRKGEGSEEGILGGKAIALLAGVFVIGGLLMFTVVGDYASYTGGGMMDSLAVSPAMGTMTEEVRYQGSRAVGFARCVGAGPHCLEEWQLNQTSRPGAESEGERFGLEIRNFELGAGESFDVAFERPEQAIPVVFDIHNPRRGIRGIEAMNVSYKVKIEDSDETYCDTGWVPVEGYTINESAEEPYRGNDLIPGTSASSGFLELTEDHSAIEGEQELTLGNCRMMQPGTRDTRNAVLRVKYDYFSQTTLSFQAMSEQVRVSEQMPTRDRDSVTADTPAKAILGVSSPATFDETDEGNEPMQPVSVGATVETEERDTSFQVRDLVIRPPERICVASNERGECIQETDSMSDAQSCSFEYDENGDLVLDEDAESRIMSGPEEDTLPQDYWFDRSTQPTIFGCVFNLDTEEHQFAVSGETLTMHMESNYTVRADENLGSFRVQNDLCREYNCPFVLPIDSDSLVSLLQVEDIEDEEYRNTEAYADYDRATCDGTAAASDGCDVILTEEVSPPQGTMSALNRGETALNIDTSFIENYPIVFTPYVQENAEDIVSSLEPSESEAIIVIEIEDLVESENRGNEKSLNITRQGQVSLEDLTEDEDDSGGFWSFVPGL